MPTYTDAGLARYLREPFEPRLLSWFPKVIKGDQCMATPYIGSRHIMERLDRLISPFGWQTGCKHEDGQLIKGLGIYSQENQRWIWRWEPGEWVATSDRDRKVVEALGAATKGLRRAAMEFGIGRYLWFLPGIWTTYNPDRKKIQTIPDIEQPNYWWALPYNHPMAQAKWDEKNGIPVEELGPDPDQPKEGTLILDDGTGTGETDIVYNESDVLFKLSNFLGIKGDAGRARLREWQVASLTCNEMIEILNEEIELKRLEEMQDG